MRYTLITLTTLIVLVATAQIPQTLNFQGFLTDSQGNPTTATQNMTFSMRRVADNNTVWTETQIDVSITNGLYNVQLGSVTPFSFAFDQEYELFVTVNDETLTPPIPLTSSAFALGAYSVFGDTNVFPSDGNVGIGTTNPTSLLHMVSETGGANAFLSSIKDDAFSNLVLFRGRGSIGGISPVLTGDLLGTMSFSGQTGEAFATSAAIVAEAAEDFGTSMGTNLKFYTDVTGDGMVDITTARMTIANYGWVGIGTETPAAELDILGADASGGVNARIQNTDATGWAGFNLRNDNRSYSLSIGGSTASTAPDKFYIFNGATSNAAFVINESDKVGVGTVNPNTTLHVDHGVNGSDVEGLSISRLGADRWTLLSAMSDSNLELYYNNTLKGEYQASNGSYAIASDRRLKKNISPAASYLAQILAIPIKEFHYKEQKDMDQKEIGVIAQELMPIFPSLVNTKSKYLSVNYSGFGPIAIKAIQEQQAIIRKLEKELAEARSKNKNLESEVNELSSSIKHIEEVLNIKTGKASKAKNK